ncbi:hypothetical protein Y1Q_0002574 [Alligator mississippiensis]|uniref:Uncharacterized protein n=1 Tax=Alligator mississippiensis TaxID=8496 RepID=A0A151N428_ALLMI|nr:hypothetical protein Y1Q_0002574 [Alligator mississippiensis]
MNCHAPGVSVRPFRRPCPRTNPAKVPGCTADVSRVESITFLYVSERGARKEAAKDRKNCSLYYTGQTAANQWNLRHRVKKSENSSCRSQTSMLARSDKCRLQCKIYTLYTGITVGTENLRQGNATDHLRVRL